jgi:regulator of protease activity HflC (stomatin/prohibitin superfamily)
MGFIIFVLLGLLVWFIVASASLSLVIIISILLFLAIILKFDTVQEGTWKAVMRFGSFRKGVLRWRGHILDADGKVITGKPKTPLGGLFFVGFRWIDSVYKYSFRRSGVKLNESNGQIEIQSKEEKLDHVMVRGDVYPAIVTDAETLASPGSDGKPESFKVSAIFLFGIRIPDPRAAVLDAPPNWLENLLAKLNTRLVRYIGTKTLVELISMRSLKTTGPGNPTLWSELDMASFIANEIPGWGVEILTVNLGDVTPAQDVQEAIAAQKISALKTKAELAKTAGYVIQVMAMKLGKTEAEMPGEIAKNPALQKEFMSQVMTLRQRDQAIDGNALIDIRVQGARGTEQSALNMLGAFQMMSGGWGQSKGAKEPIKGQKEGEKTEENKEVGKKPGERETYQEMRERGYKYRKNK